MSDYSDFMRHFGMSGQRAAELYDLFNQYYDKQHGSKRWWLSNTPLDLSGDLKIKPKSMTMLIRTAVAILYTVITMILLSLELLQVLQGLSWVFLGWLAPSVPSIFLKW